MRSDKPREEYEIYASHYEEYGIYASRYDYDSYALEKTYLASNAVIKELCEMESNYGER